jgi:hypothetical protein
MMIYKYYVYFHAFFLWNELLQYCTTKTYGFWNIFMLLQLSRILEKKKKKHIRINIKIIKKIVQIGKPTTIILFFSYGAHEDNLPKKNDVGCMQMQR